MIVMLEKLAVAEAVVADNSTKSYITGGAKVGFQSINYNLYWIVEKGLLIIEHKGTKNYTISTVANARELKPLKVQEIPDFENNDMCGPVKALMLSSINTGGMIEDICCAMHRNIERVDEHSLSTVRELQAMNKKLENSMQIMNKTNKLLIGKVPNP